MTMPIDLVFVRHGQSEGNIAVKRSRKGDHSDFTDEFLSRHSSKWRLTSEGREQAKITGEWIRKNIGKRFDRHYTSEYLRAMETAALLGLPRARWYCEFYLRERDWGKFDVMSYEERKERFADDLARREVDRFFWNAPDGESMAQLCRRIDRILGTLHRECSDKSVIIVCHGEVMWAFRVRIERMSQRRYHELDQSKDPLDQIHNCQVLHYTRKNPKTDELSPYINWMRSVCPTDLSLSRNEWEKIIRRTYSNKDLLIEAERYPCLVSG